MAKKEIKLERTYDTTREELWSAWTDPAKVKEWWGPHGVTNPVCEIDARAGGKIDIVMLAGEKLGPLSGQRWPMNGEFKEVIEPEKLVFSNDALDQDGNVLLTGETEVAISKVGGKSTLVLHTFAEGTAPETEEMLAGMEQGWNEQLDKLRDFLAR